LVYFEDAVQLCTKADMYEYLIKIAKAPRKMVLTDTVIETLSIIAYKQPVTRGQVEYIRGVNSDSAVNRLCERGLIEECGHLDAPGRPILYRTTQNFLRCFGLSTPKDLPELDLSKLSPEYEQISLQMDEDTEIEGQEEIGVEEEMVVEEE
jgi:segregation and condensation protein B